MRYTFNKDPILKAALAKFSHCHLYSDESEYVRLFGGRRQWPAENENYKSDTENEIRCQECEGSGGPLEQKRSDKSYPE